MFVKDTEVVVKFVYLNATINIVKTLFYTCFFLVHYKWHPLLGHIVILICCVNMSADWLVFMCIRTPNYYKMFARVNRFFLSTV